MGLPVLAWRPVPLSPEVQRGGISGQSGAFLAMLGRCLALGNLINFVGRGRPPLVSQRPRIDPQAIYLREVSLCATVLGENSA